jgi:methylenetetrahydrofolate dehydrogenase (NADP+)/methenyltetrahydrofolate cyclohydrolase
MTILDGKQTGNDIKAELAARVDQLVKDGKRPPHLAAVLVGNDGASLTYVGSKVRSCERIGYESTLIQLPQETTEAELLQYIDRLNTNAAIDGFIVQLPLPKHIDEEKVLMAIDPLKDVDGFHPTNFGKMALDMESFIPATPYGIIELLRRYHIDISGKHALVIGRSHIVGRPMSILLSRKSSPGNATVTLTHSRTKNLAAITKEADIVVSALGVPNFLKEDMVKEGAIIIDVGITRVPDASHPKGYVITGDVDYERVKDKASFITPVPGGVGPMTIAMLLQNTYLAYSRHADL